MPASCYILEGTWWNNREVPEVLPYFQALQTSLGGLKLGHRRQRSTSNF